MKRNHRRNNRRGNALATMGLFLLPLMAFLALSIDLGLWAIARTQCQDATDLAALAGVRTINGNTANGANNNYSAVGPAAQQAATANPVLGQTLPSSQVQVNIGRYVYNSTSQQFEGQFPGPSTDNWSLVQATTNFSVGSSLPFAKVLGISVGSIQSTATAVHRPRDIAVILDFSGSMRFSSWLGVDNGLGFATNNPDTVVPTFGHYSSLGAGQMYATNFTAPYSAANISATTNDGRPPICADFYQDASGTPAFTSAPASYATTPGGDNYLTTNKNTSTTWAQTAAQVLNISSPGTSTRDATFESQGYTAYSMTPAFNGYTQGPAYYGKTFFIWPPDPTKDWRTTYFYKTDGVTPQNDNSKLWNSSGVWQAPGSSTYYINYNAILNFIKNVGPNPFPSTLRSGRIVYYTSPIPTTIDTSTWPPSDLNQRFWKDYIDYVLGVMQTGASTYQIINNGQTAGTGYGSDTSWGTRKITAVSSLTGNPKPYMHYGDNPQRPLLNFWFGPMTMIDFLDNYNLMFQVNPNGSRYCWWPGTCHEAPMYACKLGIQAALNDIQTNHPNDYVSLIMFSVPKTSANDTGGTRFNGARVGLGQNYTNLIESLWYPPATVGNTNATVTPYDSNNLEVPRAFGGTCYAQPLMLAYNQFNAASACSGYASPAGLAGGNGRKGAQKIVIFETDGAPNTTASANLQNSGSYQSYYKVRYNPSSPSGSEYPGSVSGYGDNSATVTNQIYGICRQIVAADTASPPGYASGAREVLIHCLGFGPMFAPGTATVGPNTATLNQMQLIGNVTDGMPNYKLIYGDQNTIVNSLQQAFTKILESTVPVSLIQ
ncbi:MAG TPA: Tad domain-containing protein [Pirellulales bacterium]|nr:Tad domain-containing protein [Pirellulales bacterium]